MWNESGSSNICSDVYCIYTVWYLNQKKKEFWNIAKTHFHYIHFHLIFLFISLLNYYYLTEFPLHCHFNARIRLFRNYYYYYLPYIFFFQTLIFQCYSCEFRMSPNELNENHVIKHPISQHTPHSLSLLIYACFIWNFPFKTFSLKIMIISVYEYGIIIMSL